LLAGKSGPLESSIGYRLGGAAATKEQAVRVEDLNTGDVVVLRGMGLGKVKSVEGDVWTIRLTADDDAVARDGLLAPAPQLRVRASYT
jgi:hypothetical protein